MEFLNFIHKYSYLLTRVRFVSAFVFLLLSAEVASAGCQIGGTPYRETWRRGRHIHYTDKYKSLGQIGDDVTTCDVSTLTSLNQAFYNKTTFNQDISGWDTSSVTDMSACSWRHPVQPRHWQLEYQLSHNHERHVL